MRVKVLVAAWFGLAATVTGGAAQDRPVEIGASYQSLSRPINVAGQAGAQMAAKELGLTLRETEAGDKNDKQLNDVQDLIAQGVKGLLVWPVDSGTAIGYIAMARRANIPIIGVVTPFGRPELSDPFKIYPGLAAYVTWDDVGAGGHIGKAVADRYAPGGKKVKIAVLEGKSGFISVDLRYDGFKEALKKGGLNYEIVASQPGDWTQDKGESACQNMITGNPGLDVIFSMSDEMSVGCARAVRASGRLIPIYSIGGSTKGIDLLKKGELAATACHKPATAGLLAVQTMQKVLAGDTSVIGKTVIMDVPLITAGNMADCDPQW